MRLFGLIGYPLSHSFSKKYFTEKFEKEGIKDSKYDFFEIPTIDDLPSVLDDNPNLVGLNVTIPYKQEVFKYLDEVEPYAEEIGAVNVIKIKGGKLKGYNSDFYGFKESLIQLINSSEGKDIANLKALVLGTGGASKAVKAALKSLAIEFKMISRSKGNPDALTYHDLNEEIIKEHRLIVNTTPLGMSPKVETAPSIPYQYLSINHYLYDLVYNPSETLFMKKGKEMGTSTLNGLPMLILQAEKSWEIWNEED